MGSSHIRHVRAPILVAILLLAAALTAALDASQSAEGATSVAPVVRTQEDSWLFDDALTEALASEVIILVVCAMGCGLLVAGMEAFDLWREQREEEAAQLYSRIANALRRDRVLGHLAVTPIVRFPFWGLYRATIELRGHVPTVWLRYAVVRTTEREAATSAAACQILNRIMVVPSVEALAL